MDVKRIAVSTQAGKWLFGNSNFDLFHNGVDTKKFTFSSNARKAIRIDNMLSDELVIGHIGAFLPVKNHIFVVDLFKEFYKRHPDTRLWLIGEGYLKENIQNLVREEGMSEVVSFFGNYEDMSSVYAGMDVLLLPSLFEGFPNVVLEAQSEGLPCLLSDRITDEVVLFDSAKRLSLDDTKQVWLDELESVYQKRSFMREDAAAVVDRKGYSVNVEVKRIEKLYSSLASDKTMR